MQNTVGGGKPKMMHYFNNEVSELQILLLLLTLLPSYTYDTYDEHIDYLKCVVYRFVCDSLSELLEILLNNVQ